MQTTGHKTMPVPPHIKSQVLVEALPYIQKYEGKIFVIKYGGSAMIDDTLKESFAQDVTMLKKIGINVVIVHGGGNDITHIANKLGIETTFVQGQRCTDEKMMDVVQMVLAGKTNKNIVAYINQHGGNAIGICGIDANMLHVQKYFRDGVDLGRVGEIDSVNTTFIDLLLKNDFMPVIAPIGIDDEHKSYNVNADHAAAFIAIALNAEKLVYLSDVPGVMIHGNLISSMNQDEAKNFITSQIITNGMIPKIESAFRALESNVQKVHLIDGRLIHALLLEIFTDEGIGTELLSDHQQEHPSEIL